MSRLSRKKFYENEKRLQAFALLMKIDLIEISFNGEGDSGSIEEVTVRSGGRDFDTGIQIKVWVPGSKEFDHSKKAWVTSKEEEKLITLNDFLQQHVYEALEKTDVDWYNKDGGFGSWIWQPSVGLDFEVNRRFISEELAHTESRPLGVESA